MGAKLSVAPSLSWARVRDRRRFWILLLVLLASLLVSGCVRSDLTIQFRGQSGGQIVEHLQLADQVTAASGTTAKEWFNQIEQRTRKLGGRTKRLSNQELTVMVPFGTVADLEAKLDQLLNQSEPQRASSATTMAPEPLLQSHLAVTQQNFLLLIRNHLTLDLDLRSLGVQSLNGQTLLSPDALFNLTVQLETPWGARSSASPQTSSPTANQDQHLVWTLQPGQLNHLEASFWYPSALGIGTLVITGLVTAGAYLKYRILPLGTAAPPAPPREPTA